MKRQPPDDDDQRSLFDKSERLSKPIARQRRDEGIDRAGEHADRVTEGWREDAYTLLLVYLRWNPQGFLTEQFVEWCRGRIEAPPDGRAWGAIIQRAVRAGLIVRIGARPAATSNCSLKPEWKRTEVA